MNKILIPKSLKFKPKNIEASFDIWPSAFKPGWTTSVGVCPPTISFKIVAKTVNSEVLDATIIRSINNVWRSIKES